MSDWNGDAGQWTARAFFRIVVIAGLALPGSAMAASKPTVVVELFTSQGCSSCPPANANLIELSKRPDVLPLSFAVTYWDYLGWKDSFDDPSYTARQVAYEQPLGQQGPYTPQMVVNGSSTIVGNRLDEVERAIDKATPLTGPAVTLGAHTVEIGEGKADPAADVWLVRYDPDVVEVPVPRGENSGRTLPHTHVVHLLQRLGNWAGQSTSYDVGNEPEGMKTAVLLQEPNGGPILAAVTD